MAAWTCRICEKPQNTPYQSNDELCDACWESICRLDYLRYLKRGEALLVRFVSLEGPPDIRTLIDRLYPRSGS